MTISVLCIEVNIYVPNFSTIIHEEKSGWSQEDSGDNGDARYVSSIWSHTKSAEYVQCEDSRCHLSHFFPIENSQSYITMVLSTEST